GSELGEHDSPGDATVLVVQGRMRLVAGDTSWEGRSGNLLAVPEARLSVEAVTDTVFLLTVARRGGLPGRGGKRHCTLPRAFRPQAPDVPRSTGRPPVPGLARCWTSSGSGPRQVLAAPGSGSPGAAPSPWRSTGTGAAPERAQHRNGRSTGTGGRATARWSTPVLVSPGDRRAHAFGCDDDGAAAFALHGVLVVVPVLVLAAGTAVVFVAYLHRHRPATDLLTTCN